MGPPDDFSRPDSRNIYLIGEITEAISAYALEGLMELSSQDVTSPIHMIISTIGGDLDDCFAIYDMMKFIQAPIYTVGLGKIMSAGCLLLAAGESGHRTIGRNGRLMYHQGFQVSGGSVSDQENNAREFKRQEQLYDKLVAKECGRKLKEVERLYLGKGDVFLTADQSVAFGFADFTT